MNYAAMRVDGDDEPASVRPIAGAEALLPPGLRVVGAGGESPFADNDLGNVSAAAGQFHVATMAFPSMVSLSRSTSAAQVNVRLSPTTAASPTMVTTMI